MQTFILESPLRTIHLELQDKPQTQKEAIAIVHYKQLHKNLWKLKKHWLKCQRQSEVLKLILQEALDTYAAMETEATRYGRIGGFPDPEVDPVTGQEEYSVKIKDLIDLVNRFRELSAQYNDGNRYLTKLHKKGMRMEEGFDECLHDFDTYHFSPIIRNYEEVQVDTCSLDRDFDEFRCSCMEVMKLFDNFMDHWNEQAPLVNEMSGKVKALDVHLKMIWKSYNESNPENYDTSKAHLN